MATADIIDDSASRFGGLPPLANGDRLALAEFRERYEAMPELKKAELIKGVVYMPAAVRADHGESHFNLQAWLATYRLRTPGTVGGDNATIHVADDSEPQPDLYLRISEDAGGQSAIKDGYTTGAPELVAEIAGTSASYDLHDKLEIYRDSGVREYIVWRIYDNEIDWFELVDGRYSQRPVDTDGITHSVVFPGLWLDKAAILKDDTERLLQVLNAGLDAAEHVAFVEQLKKTQS